MRKTELGMRNEKRRAYEDVGERLEEKADEEGREERRKRGHDGRREKLSGSMAKPR